MKTPTQPPRLSRSAGFDGDMDGLLRSFFRSEMPDPWPKLKVPSPHRPAEQPRPRPWSIRLHSHFALAAAVIACLVGYGILQASFPAPVADHRPNIERSFGKIPGRERIEPLPAEVVPVGDGSTRAVITGHKTAGPRPTITLHLQELK